MGRNGTHSNLFDIEKGNNNFEFSIQALTSKMKKWKLKFQKLPKHISLKFSKKLKLGILTSKDN